MKRIWIMVGVIWMFAVSNGYTGWLNTPTYKAGQCYSYTEITDSDINFGFNKWSFAIKGTGYAVIKSSFSETGDTGINIDSSRSCNQEFSNRMSMYDKKIIINIIGDATCYWLLEGDK